MKNKNAFSMIELIFVIVIIGILAAVAIPKLAANRDDAKISKTVSNLKILLYDAHSFYLSQGGLAWRTSNWGDVTDTLDALQGTTSTLNTSVKVYGENNIDCFVITPNTDNNGTTSLVVTFNNISDVICSKAQVMAKQAGIVSNLSSTEFILGGQSVTF